MELAKSAPLASVLDTDSVLVERAGVAPYRMTRAVLVARTGEAVVSNALTSTSTSAQTVLTIDFAALRGLNLQGITAHVEVVVTIYQATGALYSATFKRICAVRREAGNITIKEDENPINGGGDGVLGDGYATAISFVASGTQLRVSITPLDAGSTAIFALGRVVCSALP